MLEAEVNAVHDNIYTLRSLEIWEDATQINKAFSPLSCGDVFILDEEEIPKAQYSDRMFMLLGQPCDVQLRPDGKKISRLHIWFLDNKEYQRKSEIACDAIQSPRS